MAIIPTDAIERFWSKVDQRAPDECWEWTGARDQVKGRPDGTRWGNYGVFYIDKRHCRIKAHRIAYCLVHGDIPPRVKVRHTCDNPPCCNPRHLVTGTHKQNMDDMQARGRKHIDRGQSHPHAKLTDEQAREILALRPKRQPRASEVARRFGVSAHTVKSIWQGYSWKHLRKEDHDEK